MTISKEQKKNIKKEVTYLENKEHIRNLLEQVGYENVFRYMVEDLDHIDDINNTQSIYLFEIISMLEKVLEIYPRLKHV
tara:strand:- start:10495 stop:10731 length:237 start_codon:yes stop_codon:yes gene_type:complete